MTGLLLPPTNVRLEEGTLLWVGEMPSPSLNTAESTDLDLMQLQQERLRLDSEKNGFCECSLCIRTSDN